MVVTDPNHFGVFRQYPVRPRREPDDESSLYELCDHTFLQRARPKPPGNSVRGYGRVIAQRVRSQVLADIENRVDVADSRRAILASEFGHLV